MVVLACLRETYERCALSIERQKHRLTGEQNASIKVVANAELGATGSHQLLKCQRNNFVSLETDDTAVQASSSPSGCQVLVLPVPRRHSRFPRKHMRPSDVTADAIKGLQSMNKFVILINLSF